MSLPVVVGSWIQIRTDLSDAEKNATGAGCWNANRESFVGRIGIVRKVDSDRTLHIFWGVGSDGAAGADYFWRMAWITVLTPADIEKLDARFAKTLRDDFAKEHPSLATKPASFPATGSLVQIRSNLTDAEKLAGSPSVRFRTEHQIFVGRVAIVVQADPDHTVKLFFSGTDTQHVLWWHNSWVTTLTAADEAKQDAQFVRDLRKSLALKFPEATAMRDPVPTQAAKRIKTAVGEIRIKLADIERDVAALE